MKTLNQIVKQLKISKSDIAVFNGISKQRLNGWTNLPAHINDGQIDLYQNVTGLYLDKDLYESEVKYRHFRTLNIPTGV